MAINKNHEFEELNGIKCAIVEKNASIERLAFLKPLLEFNKYEVVAVPTPVKAPPAAPAAAPAPASAPANTAAQPTPASATSEAIPSAAATPQATAAEVPVAPPPPPAPETYTIGVTNVMFNPINAIFGRLLRTPDGHIVTLAYWQQKEAVSNDDIPYYDKA